MDSNQIRQAFLDFFEKRGHKIIPSALLVTSDDRSVTNSTLFNTAGMQPLVPYLMGKEHPAGKRLADVQRCVRTIDIDDVGDRTHATFFEMLGNWSLGDYFKKEAINWSYEFLTSSSEGLGLDPNRLYVTVFEGDEVAPRDEEAAGIWSGIFNRDGINGERIFYLPASSNWWEAGENGPCGPDSEMYYDVNNKFGGRGISKEEFLAADESRDLVEVWNDVFMQYRKENGKVVGPLPAKNVDTGAGLERLCMVTQGVDSIYETDLLRDVVSLLSRYSQISDTRAKRIVTDHVRTAVFLIADGVTPSNTDRGYVLRRLIRRAIRYCDVLGLDQGLVGLGLIDSIIIKYSNTYPYLIEKIDQIKHEINKEEEKFRKTLEKGMREFEKAEKNAITANIAQYSLGQLGELKLDMRVLPGKIAFDLYQTYGFPLELTEELAREKNIVVDKKGFSIELNKHQELSRKGAEQKFRGGLAGSSEQIVKYHTATHLLQQALVDVLGEQVMQKGSNITDERLRFDFTCDHKLTEDEKKKVEDIVNEKITADLPVKQVILPKSEAEKSGARHLFNEKYGDEVSVYYIGDSLDNAYSKEFCGGPHITRTGLLGHFKIQKEEAVSAGVRRIKAILE